jgi:AcrR family transcriptional regulator
VPRRTRDPESRRRLIAAAWRLVAVQGVHATTIRAIAAEAGVTTGSVTHYFEDKAEVMASVLRYNNRLAAQNVLGAAGNRTGLDAIDRGVRAILPLDEERLRTWTVWFAFWGDRGAHRLVAREGGESGFGALTGWLTYVFTEAVAAGELPETLDPAHETDRLLVLIGGLGVMTGGAPQLLKAAQHRSSRMLAEHLAGLAQLPV